MKQNKRILSIDIMRGLTLFLMLFVNDLYVSGVPKWLVHTEAHEDAMGLADWVFPGFLFMVGLSIPFAFMSRAKKGESTGQLIIHIIKRTLSLLLIGVFMINSHRLNPELSGINKIVWVILGYISIFLIWNKYPRESKNKSLFKILKYTGILGLIVLAIIFRSGTIANPSWLITSWWGILGLIGWGYFITSMVYLWLKDRLWLTVGAWVSFLLLNILSQLSYTEFLAPIKPVFGVIIEGSVPSIVLSGLVIGILLKKYRSDYRKLLSIIIPIGFLCLLSALILKNWFIISKIQATPSWGMLCNGISILLFGLLFYIIDRKDKGNWFYIFKPAGENSLTTYLAPDIFYYLIWTIYYLVWTMPLNAMFYKQDEMTWLAVVGSLVWALLMIGLASLLAKISIRLKI